MAFAGADTSPRRRSTQCVCAQSCGVICWNTISQCPPRFSTTHVTRVRTTPPLDGSPGGRNAYPVSDTSWYTIAIVPVRNWISRTSIVCVLPANGPLKRNACCAIRDLQETLELNPQSELALQLLGHAYLQKGMNDEALDAFRRAAALSGVRDSAHLAYGYAVTGHQADAKRVIEMLVATDRSRYLPPFHIALAYAGLGDKDAAFRWLERAFDEHASFMDGLKVTPGFDVLHSDPRFAALLARMNL